MDQGPVLIITFQAQLVMVIRNPKGEVVEGDPVSSVCFFLLVYENLVFCKSCLSAAIPISQSYKLLLKTGCSYLVQSGFLHKAIAENKSPFIFSVPNIWHLPSVQIKRLRLKD